MLKYVDTKVVFREIPDEITLAVNISGCPCACEGCHSSYLAGDIGEELTAQSINELLTRHSMISCISFMGGDADPAEVSELAGYIKSVAPNMKVAWYSGRDELSNMIDISYFDFIKIGSYQSDKGGLDSPKTNQRLYRVNPATQNLENVTNLLTNSKFA